MSNKRRSRGLVLMFLAVASGFLTGFALGKMYSVSFSVESTD